MVIRAKILGKYRRCEFLGSKGNTISVRVTGDNPGIDGMPSLFEITFDQVKEEDRQACLEQNPDLNKKFQVITVKDILFQERNITIKSGKTIRVNCLEYKGNSIAVLSKKYGELRLPLEAIRIEERAE